jgi:hypothetical protein
VLFVLLQIGGSFQTNIFKCPLDFSNSTLYSSPWLVPMFCVGNPDTEYPSVLGENDPPLSAKIDIPDSSGRSRQGRGAQLRTLRLTQSTAKGDSMRVLNIVASPRKDHSASRALVDAFLREYMRRADDIIVDTLDVWQEWLPEFDAETINAKYKGVSGEPMTPAEVAAWEMHRHHHCSFYP